MVYGACDVDDRCVSSYNYPRAYGNSQFCNIKILQKASVTSGEIFSIERKYDLLMINGIEVVQINAIPRSLHVGDIISWSTDSSFAFSGWQLCFSEFDPLKNEGTVT